MKAKYLIMLLSGVFTIGCIPENEYAGPEVVVITCLTELPEWTVAGYDDCFDYFSIDDGYGEAGGYLLVTANLKDTFLTYNFPDDVFRFPEEVFNKAHLAWFDETARKTLKFRIECEIVPEDEKDYRICTAQYPMHFMDNDYRQIIVTSAIKVD